MLTHNFPSLFGAVNWLQLFTSTSRIYPITRWHSFTVSLSSCCCIFKYDSFSAFSWFMLLYRMPPPPHLPITAQSSHIHHLHHLISLSVAKESSATSIRTPWGGGETPFNQKKISLRVKVPKTLWRGENYHICCDKHFLYCIHVSLLIEIILYYTHTMTDGSWILMLLSCLQILSMTMFNIYYCLTS